VRSCRPCRAVPAERASIPPYMADVLVLFPQERDRRAIAAAGLDRRHRVRFFGNDLDATEAFDPEAFVVDAADVAADAVVASKDQAALLAAIVAQRRGLPGPSPASLVACQHKPTSRRIQRAVAPDSTPRFALLDGRLPFAPPFFAKPVVGRLSQGARRIEREADLDELEELEDYAARYERIMAVAGVGGQATRGFLAEELLTGLEVTLEGYAHAGRVTTIGITDSILYPGTISFERFEYPTRLDAERRAELAGLAKLMVDAHGLDDAFFNVEFFVPERGPAGIVELNARIASQFEPLVRRLDGRSTYDALFEVATGRDPQWTAREPDGFGVSYVIRVFRDAIVDGVPEPEEGLEILVRPGLRLSEQGTNDAGSYRLAIFCAFGETREEALARARERARSLSFRLSPDLATA
jgi:hypothetical protein